MKRIILVLSLTLLSAAIFAQSYLLEEKNGKVGMLKDGKKFIPAKYEKIIRNGNYSAVLLNGKWGYLDLNTGKEITAAKYENLSLGLFEKRELEFVVLNGKWGYVNKKGEEIIPTMYEEGKNYFNNIGAMVKLNGKWGIVDANNKETLPFNYDDIELIFNLATPVGLNEKDGAVKVKLNGKWGLANASNKEILPTKYDEIECLNKGLYAIKLDEKFGLANQSGKEIIPCEYDEYNYTYYNLFGVKQNGLWGFVDISSGKKLIPIKFKGTDGSGLALESCPRLLNGGDIAELMLASGEIIYMDEEGFRLDSDNRVIEISISKDVKVSALEGQDLLGLMDKNGKEILKPTYTHIKKAGENTNNLAIVSLNKKFGVIDISGKILTELKYDIIEEFKHGFAKINIGGTKKGKWGLINESGKIIVPCEYDAVTFDSRESRTYDNDKELEEEDEDELEIDDELEVKEAVVKIESPAPGFVVVSLNGKYGLFDLNGKLLTAPKYDIIENTASDGYTKVNIGGTLRIEPGNKRIVKGGKWGILDKTGKEIISCKYDFIYNFDFNDYAMVNNGGQFNILNNTIVGGKWGLVDKSGKETIPCLYDDLISPFKDGKNETRAKQNGKWGMINKQNKTIIPFAYDYIGTDFYSGLVAVNNGATVSQNGKNYSSGKWGFVNKTGNLVIPIKFDVDSDFQYPPYFSEYDKTAGVLSEEGKYILIDTIGNFVKADENAERYRKYLNEFYKSEPYVEPTKIASFKIDDKKQLQFTDDAGYTFKLVASGVVSAVLHKSQRTILIVTDWGAVTIINYKSDVVNRIIAPRERPVNPAVSAKWMDDDKTIYVRFKDGSSKTY